MQDQKVILLKQKEFIASGVFCSCYAHPELLEECIKIPNDVPKSKKRLATDLSYYRKLSKRQADMSHISNYLGKCQTSLGVGYRYECIRDEDSQVSKTLEYYLQQDESQQVLICNQLAKLANYLLKNRIMIGDLHANNILMQRTSTELRPVIVDGVGDRVAITILNVFPSLVEAKIKRRWNRFAAKFLNSKVTI